MLFARGEAVRVGDMDEVKKIEKEINDRKFKEEQYMTPICGVFMTF